MAEGISPNPLNKISQVYLDRIAKINTDPEVAQKEREKWQSVEEEKKSLPKLKMYRKAGNLARAGDEKSMKRQTKIVSTLNKETEKGYKKAALDKLRDGSSPKHQAESFSSWRNDLREIVDEIESKAEKEVKEKKGINNKVKINPVLTDAVEQMGGQLLEVAEVEDNEDDKDAQKADALKKKEAMLKKRIVRMKMQAVNQGAGETVIASYDPLENAVEYFYEEGINEEGIDLLIEEVGLDDFVDFVDGGGAIDLNEERAARRANVKAKSYAQVKKEVDTADAARKKAKKGEYAPSYTKKETDVTVYDDKPAAKKKAPAKKPAVKKEAPKPAPKKKIVKPVAKKVERAVTKVKKSQPKKEVSKKGIRGAIERGVARHKKAVGDAKAAYSKARAKGKVPEQRAKEFGKGVVSGVKTAVKVAKDIKKVVSEKLDYDPMDDPDFDPHEAEKKRGVSGKNNPKGGKKLKDLTKEGFSDWRDELQEKDLSAAERRALPDKDFVFPGKGEGPEGKQRGAYPINDKKHARAALAMAAAHASPEKEAKVKAAVKKKFPDIQQEGYKKLPVAKMASKISKKQFKAGQSGDVKTISKKSTETGKMIGVLDTHDPERSKSKSKMQEGLVGAKVDSQKEVNKATRKAAFRPFANTKPPKLKVAEDKAFDNVVGKLRKKYGKDAVLTKDSPKPKAQPQPKAKPQKPLTDKEKAHREVIAQYGGEANYKAGRGLGT